jgi:hypothetical protein
MVSGVDTPFSAQKFGHRTLNFVNEKFFGQWVLLYFGVFFKNYFVIINYIKINFVYYIICNLLILLNSIFSNLFFVLNSSLTSDFGIKIIINSLCLSIIFIFQSIQ